MDYTFNAPLFVRPTANKKTLRWCVTLPQAGAEQISKYTAEFPRRGRGAIKVTAMLGYMQRDTSIFPDKNAGTYILFIKKEIRKEFSLNEGDTLCITIRIV